jgi:hypothetical protein
MSNPLLIKFPVTFPTLGWTVIDWIENYLVHGPGDIQGSPSSLIWRSVRSSAGHTGFSRSG